jgi:dipeptidyl aminopeptidase/acylaminoacyl peptidase
MKSTRIVCALVLLFILPTRGRTQDRPLNLQTMDEGVAIADPVFSPDGQEILLRSDRTGRQKLWIVSRNGSTARLLIDDEGTEVSGVWSPDGSQIAFVRVERGQPDIWLVRPDGSDLRQLTDDVHDERTLKWSPDSRRIALLSGRDGAQDVFLLDLGEGNIDQLTTETNPWDEYRWEPVWSPDGSMIAYVSNRSGTFEDDLWVVDVATKKSEMLSSNIQVVSTPIWSPDGKWVAFNSVERDGLWYHEMSDIHLLEVETSELRKLEMNAYVSDRFSTYKMAWSPDSRSIYFRYEWEGDVNLWRVGPDGGVATKMTYEEGSMGQFAVSPTGDAIVYVRSTPILDGEVHRFDLLGGSTSRLTEWQPRFAEISAAEKITFRSKDGLYILGYFYRPPDFDSGERYPALVQVHGGGNNAYGNGFHVLDHLLAHEGFVVLAIEYRGSSGHGREFQRLSLGEFGAGQGWDAVAAAEFLSNLPFTNGKVGIYGGSYGGIMTMAAVTRDSRPFDAAAPFYGIYDWAAAFSNADRLAKLMIIKGHFGFKPEENPTLYQHTASLKNLENVSQDLPFLIIHGEQDRRAPFQQSELLVDALRSRGNPVSFHAYPEEAHGFRLPKNRRHAYGELISFFLRHLSGER